MKVSKMQSDNTTVSQLTQMDAAAKYRAQLQDPAIIKAVVSLRHAYPTLTPAVALGMAQRGLTVNDDVVKKLVLMDANGKKKGGFWDKVGSTVGHVAGQVGHALGQVPHAVGAGLEPWTQEVKRDTRAFSVALDTSGQELQNIERSAIYTGVGLAQGNIKVGQAPSTFFDSLQAQKTPLGVIINDWKTGQPVDLGTGFMPNQNQGVYADVRSAATSPHIHVFLGPKPVDFGGTGLDAQGNKVNNLAITPGRTVAATVAEPGTTAFSLLSGIIDFGGALLDPAALLGKEADAADLPERISAGAAALRDTKNVVTAAKTVAQRHTFTDPKGALANLAGLLPGHTDTTIPERTASFLRKGGAPIVQKLAETGTDDFGRVKIYEGMKRPSAPGSIAFVDKAAKISDPVEEAQHLQDSLGSTFRETPQYLGYRAGAMHKTGVRLLDTMPGRHVDLNSPEDVYEQVRRLGVAGKVTPAVRSGALDRVFDAGNDPSALRQVVLDALKDYSTDIASRLDPKVNLRRLEGETDAAFASRVASAKTSAAKKVADSVTRAYADALEGSRAYTSDELVANHPLSPLALDNQLVQPQHPLLLAEYHANTMPLPPAREMREVTSKLTRLRNIQGADKTAFDQAEALANAVNNQFKNVVTLKASVGAKHLVEANLAMAASGMHVPFLHPLQMMSSVVASPEAVERLAGITAKDAARHPIMAGEKALAKLFEKTGVEPDRVIGVNGGGLFTHDSSSPIDLFKEWLANNVVDPTDSSVSRFYDKIPLGDPRYAQAHADAIMELANDPIAARIASHHGVLDSVKGWLWGEGQGYRRQLEEKFPEMRGNPGLVDKYVDSVAQIVEDRTNNDPALLDAIGSGWFNGREIGRLDDKGLARLNPDLAQHLATVQGPPVLKGIRTAINRRQANGWDKTTSFLHDLLLNIPVREFTQKPILGEAYWNRAEELLPHTTPEVGAELLRNAAAKGGASAEQLARLRKITERTGQITDINDLHVLAQKYAVDQMKSLIYTLHDRGQWTDAFRVLLPFGEVWRQQLRRWLSIAWQHPQTVRRAQQIYTGAQGSGFFHKDQYGNEVYSIPILDNLSRHILGQPVDLTSPVKGLSALADVGPSVGPILSIPVAAALPNTPTFDQIRERLAPYETPGSENLLGNIATAALPSWMKDLRQAMEGPKAGRQYTDMVGKMANYIISQGKLDPNDPEQLQQIIDQANSGAKKLSWTKMLADFLVPSTTTTHFHAKTKGDLGNETVLQEQLSSFFYKLQKPTSQGGAGLDYNEAVDQYISAFGADAFTALQGFSTTIRPALPVSKQAGEWERAHPEIVHKYNDIWGLFAPGNTPDAADKDFDYSTWLRQMSRGDRQELTPEQRIDLAQRAIASHIYQNKRAEVGPNPTKNQRDYLQAIHDTLVSMFPAYAKGAIPGLPDKVKPDVAVEQLRRAIADPRLAKNRGAIAAATYLEGRDRAIADIQASQKAGGHTVSKGSAALGTKAADVWKPWLAALADRIIAKYPEFESFFQSVFASEVGE